MNLIIIIAHCLLHLGCALYFYKKDGVSVRSFLYSYISCFCLGGVLLLYTNKYFDVMENPHFSKNDLLPIIPYCFNFIFTYFILQIWKSFNATSFDVDIKPVNNKIIQFAYGIGISYIILKIFQFTITIRYGMGHTHDLGAEELDEIFYSSFRPLLLINYLGRINNIVILPYLIAFFFIGFHKCFFDFKRVVNILTLYAVSSILTGAVGGSRALMLFSFFNVVFFIVVFWKWIPILWKKKFVTISIIVLCLFVIIFSIIGSERFSRHSGFDNVLRYFGESYLNLGFEFYNNLLQHTDGMFCFGTFIKNNSVYSLHDLTGTNAWWFQTLYGCLYIDFGLFIPFLFPFILLICMRLLFSRHRKITKLGNVAIILFMFKQSYLIPFGFHLSFLDMFFLLLMLLIPRFLDKYFVKNV